MPKKNLNWKETEYSVNTPVHQYMGQLPPCTSQYDPISVPDEISSMETVEWGDGLKVYVNDKNEYFSSITRMLKATDKEGQKALEKWRASVGVETAQAISTAASKRGTKWHKFCELYLTGKTPGWEYVTTSDDRRMAIHIALMLNSKIKRVLANELTVVSHQYGIFGALDLCAELTNGKIAIIDFKTGKRKKAGNRLDQAAIQGAFYAEAMTEHIPFGIVDTVVVAQLCPSRLYWQETPASIWQDSLRTKITEYTEILNANL
jgi:hypothetical protein